MKFVAVILLALAALDAHCQVNVICPQQPAPCDLHITYGIPTVPLKFKAGDRIVVLTGGVNVRATPALAGTLLGAKTAGTLGVILAGPVLDPADGLNRWNVNFDSGVDGWAGETMLGPSTLPLPSVTFDTLTLSFASPINTDSAVQLVNLVNNTNVQLPLTFSPLTGTGFRLGGKGLGCGGGVMQGLEKCSESFIWHPVTTGTVTGTASIVWGTPPTTTVIQLVGTVTAPLPPVLNINLSWIASTSSGVTGYNLYRGTVTGGPYTKVNTALITVVPTATTPYKDLSAVKGTSYFYRATAVAGTKESMFSNEAHAIAP